MYKHVGVNSNILMPYKYYNKLFEYFYNHYGKNGLERIGFTLDQNWSAS